MQNLRGVSVQDSKSGRLLQLVPAVSEKEGRGQTPDVGERGFVAVLEKSGSFE